MLSRGINRIPAAKGIHSAKHIVGAACGNMVKVEGQHVAAVDGIAFTAPAVMYDAAHKPADIFQVVLLRFREFQVSDKGFSAACRDAQALDQLRPIEGLQRPAGCIAAVACADGYLTVILEHRIHPRLHLFANF